MKELAEDAKLEDNAIEYRARSPPAAFQCLVWTSNALNTRRFFIYSSGSYPNFGTGPRICMKIVSCASVVFWELESFSIIWPDHEQRPRYLHPPACTPAFITQHNIVASQSPSPSSMPSPPPSTLCAMASPQHPLPVPSRCVRGSALPSRATYIHQVLFVIRGQ
ncbi:hypothetical protein E2C01_041514 [Portunus trituberculatus]|uniref:Uncharacterized protein n=1 Tax=Portunus trituberculatus TaxID=210409 RepID=A0A5B7FQY1_PORTR|nr:hypothetical protein [Portunus trituberculatus]